MTYYNRRSVDWFPVGIGAFLVGLVVLMGWLVMRQIEWADECRAKGGTPHCPYKSSCVCLAKGMVIE